MKRPPKAETIAIEKPDTMQGKLKAIGGSMRYTLDSDQVRLAREAMRTIQGGTSEAETRTGSGKPE